jgi:hypothetical protein
VLGAYVAGYRGSPKTGVALTMAGVVFIGLGLMNLVVGMVELLRRTEDAPLYLGIAPCLLVLGALVLLPILVRWRQSVDLFEHGFVWKRITRTLTIRRDQIRSVARSLRKTRYEEYVVLDIELSHGKVRIAGLTRGDELADQLIRWT